MFRKTYNFEFENLHQLLYSKMVLWKKESSHADACYTDLLCGIEQNQFSDKLAKLMCVVSAQSDDKSTEFRMRGNQQFQEKNWRAAMELYNKSLRYATDGSENISLAYANRSVCFFQIQKYEQCLVDIELAKKANYPERLMHKLNDREAACLKMLGNGSSKPMEKAKPVLGFEADEMFPSIANALEIRSNDELGNHLVAKRDIDAGQIVMVTEMLVSSTHCEDHNYCKTCLKPTMNFIPCPTCCDVLFCDDNCLASNDVHKMACIAVRCQTFDFVRIVESILIGVTAFADAASFMAFVQSALATRDLALPRCNSDVQTKYSMFLKMKFSEEEIDDDLHVLLLWSYHLLMKIPEIEQRFQSKQEKRFLMHLILQHQLIFTSAWSEFYDIDNETDANYLTFSGIFLFQTMVKLACVPNISFKCHGNHVFVYTVRPVKMGDQLTMESPHPKSAGQCDCSKCAPTLHPEYGHRLIMDPDYHFMAQTSLADFDNREKRLVLKTKLAALLQKYGGLPWSESIDYFVTMLDYCMQKEHCF